MKKRNSFLYIVLISFFFITSCTNSGVDEDTGPVILSFDPISKAVNMPGFTFTVKGRRFTEFSRIYFNDSIMETTYVSSGELTCEIPAALIASQISVVQNINKGMNTQREVPVRVNNGGGNFSEKLYFPIRDNNLFYTSSVITEGAVNSFNPSITVDTDGKLYIVYERYEESERMYHASVLISEDGGLDWEGPNDIYSSIERIYNPSLESGGDGKIYVTFFCEKLLFSSSDDSGENWAVPTELSMISPSPIESSVFTDSSGFIYVMWLISSYSSDPSIYFQRSENGGASFSPAINISSERNNFSHVYSPSFDANESGIYAAWTAWPSGGSRYSFSYFNYSTDQGETWNSKDKYFGVTSSPWITAGDGDEVRLAISSSYLPFSNRIVLYSSEDGGSSWAQGVGVTSESNDTRPLMRTDSEGNINIIFKRGNEYQYSRSIDGGISWSEPLFVTDKISSEYRKRLIDMDIDAHGTLLIVTEFDSTGVLYFTKSY